MAITQKIRLWSTAYSSTALNNSLSTIWQFCIKCVYKVGILSRYCVLLIFMDLFIYLLQKFKYSYLWFSSHFSCVHFFKKHLYWSIIALQWCVSFCFITKWISYAYTYIPISPPSCISLPPSLYHPSRWTQSTELISLCYVAASH